MSDDGTTHSDGHLRSLIFQAKVDAAYLHRGLELVPPVITRHKLSSEVVKLAVDTIYSYNNISRLAWLPTKKRSLSLLKKMSIDNVAIIKSLVLKRDVSEIYQEYVIKHTAQFPNTLAMKKSLFYTITNLITGGSKKQQIRAGVDYIKVNYHTDNYQLVDKVIDIVAPASDADQTVREQLYLQRSTVFTVES